MKNLKRQWKFIVVLIAGVIGLISQFTISTKEPLFNWKSPISSSRHHYRYYRDYDGNFFTLGDFP